MRLITGLRIEGFRSIFDECLDEIGELTTLVGRNSSGKSNVLRALNLFFKGEPEGGQTLEFAQDLHSTEAQKKSKRRKQVSITVDFEIPPYFAFRKGLKPLETKLGKTFSIRRTWQLDAQLQTRNFLELFVGKEKMQGGEEDARVFLSLLNFRYIPNRTVPSTLLREEGRAIASAVAGRVKQQGVAELLGALNKASESLLRRAATSLRSVGSPLEDPAMTTPLNVGELLTITGFRAKGQHGGIVRDIAWGAGHQSFFLFEVLQAVDTNYGGFFGWKQAAIWGVEEPESGLHRDLETRLADELRSLASDQRLKLQIIQTTHSPIFTMASDRGFFVELREGRSHINPSPIPKLVRASEEAGIAHWVQPVLAYPWNPVVLVEGSADAEVLNHAAKLLGREHLRFFPISDLDSTDSGSGKDSLTGYLRRHQRLLGNRPVSAPLLALYDWELSNQEFAKAQEAYGSGGTRKIIRMDARHADPKIGKDFRGIERFYSPNLVAEAFEAGEFLVAIKDGHPYSISSGELSKAKGLLKRRFLKISDATQIGPLQKVIDDLIAIIELDDRHRQASLDLGTATPQ